MCLWRGFEGVLGRGMGQEAAEGSKGYVGDCQARARTQEDEEV